MPDNSKTKKRRVVIVGGGFGGIKTALELEKSEYCDISLISNDNAFYYHANLYRTATGADRDQTEIPLSDIFINKQVKVIKDNVTKIDRANKQITGDSGKNYSYDTLVLAIGAVTNYFHIHGLAEHSFGIKTYSEAMDLKNHLHDQLVGDKKPDLNYIIIGGGASGVELAGELPSYLRKILKQHKVKRPKTNIRLLEAQSRLMSRLDKKVSISIEKRLKSLGVIVQLNKKVEGETVSKIMVDGKPIDTHTVIWTAGIKNHPFFEKNSFRLSARGLVEVNEYLEAEPDIYVIGDNADTKFSGMAQTAVRDGVFVAENIVHQVKDQSMADYQPKQPVYVTPVGPHWASVVWGKKVLSGRLGWLIRRAAEYTAYREVQTWWKASKSWLSGFVLKESCPTCAVSNQEESSA